MTPPLSHSLAFQTDLALRQLEGASVRACPMPGLGAVQVVTSPENPTFWWGNFLLMPRPPRPGELPVWEAAFREAHPQARHLTFGLDAAQAQMDPVADEEFRAAGLTAFSDTVLTAHSLDVHAPPAPRQPVTLRPLDPQQDTDWEAAAALRLAVNAADPSPLEAAGYRTFVTRKLAAARQAQARGQGASFGAFDASGDLHSLLAVFGAGQGVARYQNVETHPEARSQGLAGALVHQAAGWAHTHLGAHTLVIVADPHYHAQRLYERLGFRATEVQLGWQRPPAGA